MRLQTMVAVLREDLKYTRIFMWCFLGLNLVQFFGFNYLIWGYLANLQLTKDSGACIVRYPLLTWRM